MKNLLLAGVGAVLFSGVAYAQIPVTDLGLITVSQMGWVQQAMDMVHTLEQLKAQYETMTAQLNAIAHLPDNVMSMANGLVTTPTLQNPLPQTAALARIMNGSALGPVNGLASSFQSLNRYAAPTGTDFTAQEMNARAAGVSGIQAMATNAMQSIETRITDLKDFIAGIGSSPDIQQTEAINARLALEQNYISSQQAQAQNLKTLADAQQQVADMRREEKQRQDATDLVTATSGVALP